MCSLEPYTGTAVDENATEHIAEYDSDEYEEDFYIIGPRMLVPPYSPPLPPSNMRPRKTLLRA